ncbi:MAG: glycosyltransferase [Candidatus Ranarchaeia archaeon]
MKRILVMCWSDLSSDPRPHRIIQCLKKTHIITTMARQPIEDRGVRFIPIPGSQGEKGSRIRRMIFLTLRMFHHVLWTKDVINHTIFLRREHFDLIVIHNLDLLPFALRIRKDAKILFDSREYYPRQFEDRFVWRVLYQHFNKYLCKNYLDRCDKVITVSKGIADEYRREYGVSPQVVKSLPDFYDITPSHTEEDRLTMIHHGGAIPSRRIELMIYMMDYVDERFSLELMLMPTNRNYKNFLKKEAAKRPNVRIISPVKFEEIIPFTRQYDIGLYLLHPLNFNQKHSLPNKLFEFIQARLMVAIGPSADMKSIVEQYDCGIVSKNFCPQSLARELNSLTVEKVRHYKTNSHKAAQMLNSKITCSQIENIVTNLIDY